MNKRRLSHNQRRRIAQQQSRKLELEGALEGTVITHYGKEVTVEDEQHRLHQCKLRQNLGDLVCGDRVSFQPQGENAHGVVLAIHPRNNLLQKTGFGGKAKPVAANIDQVLIVSAVQPPPNPYLIDRYIVATENLPANAILVLNKIDLGDEAQTLLAQLQQNYQDIGLTILPASAKTGQGIDELKILLQDHTSIFVGLSGVGKSSLVNTVIPDVDIKVGEVSHASQEGTHTTTVSTLYHLPSGGDLIDSPGVRDFTPVIENRQQILNGFAELRQYAGLCKFNDCTHTREPGCAVRRAIENGEINPQRLQSYQHMLKDLEDNN